MQQCAAATYNPDFAGCLLHDQTAEQVPLIVAQGSLYMERVCLSGAKFSYKHIPPGVHVEYVVDATTRLFLVLRRIHLLQ